MVEIYSVLDLPVIQEGGRYRVIDLAGETVDQGDTTSESLGDLLADAVASCDASLFATVSLEHIACPTICVKIKVLVGNPSPVGVSGVVVRGTYRRDKALAAVEAHLHLDDGELSRMGALV
jgi:hypothetical protein